ncbi:Uncharacterised protein [Chlamydia trachomatis]|nr:Uncharacterised protein [Chlamydia trachomatis]
MTGSGSGKLNCSHGREGMTGNASYRKETEPPFTGLQVSIAEERTAFGDKGFLSHICERASKEALRNKRRSSCSTWVE